MRYVTVRIPLEDALEMLTDRVRHWTKDVEAIDMYRQMYKRYLRAGVFEGAEFDIDTLVDNDYHNDCVFVSKGEENWSALLACYRENGLGTATNGGHIEAVDNEDNPACFLVRY